MQELDSHSEPKPVPPDGSNLLIDAVYEDGVIKPLDLPAGTALQLAINRRIRVVATPQIRESVTPVALDKASSTSAANLGLSAAQSQR